MTNRKIRSTDRRWTRPTECSNKSHILLYAADGAVAEQWDSGRARALGYLTHGESARVDWVSVA